MRFGISIKWERRIIRLQVEQVSHDATKERFKVIARNNSFVLESNRPLLLGKGLKYKPVNWKVVEGGYDRPVIRELIIKAIEKHLHESV